MRVEVSENKQLTISRSWRMPKLAWEAQTDSGRKILYFWDQTGTNGCTISSQKSGMDLRLNGGPIRPGEL